MRKPIRKPIPTFEVPAKVFDYILERMSPFVEKVDTVNTFKYGYAKKHIIYYDGNEYMTINRSALNYYCPEIPLEPHYMQCIVRRVENIKQAQSNISGYHAYLYMNKALLKFYSQDEIHDILNSYKDDRDDRLKQAHFLKEVSSDYVSCYKNTFKYDINGAHTYALTQMFPKAKDKIIQMYLGRKKNPKLKKILNYYVGCLVPKGFVGAYNHIVHETTKKLVDFFEKVGGTPLYINTDGFVVRNPNKILKGSTELGQVKLEYSGDTYIYAGRNYWVMQQGDELTGSVLTEVRDRLDLSKGLVVKYKNKLMEIDGVSMRKAVDVEDIKVEVKEVTF